MPQLLMIYKRCRTNGHTTRSGSPEKKRAWLTKYVGEIAIGNDGLYSVTIKIQTATGYPIYSVGGFRSWVDLCGGDITTMEGRLECDGLYLAGYVADKLGLTVPQLQYMIVSGKLPEPAKKHGRHRAWTIKEIDKAMKIFVHKRI